MRKLRKRKQAIMDKVVGPRWFIDWCTNNVPHAPGVLCVQGTVTGRVSSHD